MSTISSRRRSGVLTGVLAALTLFLAGCSGDTAGSAPTDPTGTAPVTSASAPSAASSSATTAPSEVSEPSTPSSSSSSSSVPESVAPAAPSSFVPPAPPPPVTTGPILPASRPTLLEVPSIGVSSQLLNLGQNPDGTIQVPDVDDPNSPAGWYNGSPTPGELGPSILLGHVDSRALGPGVFYDLDQLQPGAEIRVTREDGTVALFQVDRVASYAKLDFPTLSVYGNLDHAGLRLITCGGVFDADAGSYESNIVAYATLVGQA